MTAPTITGKVVAIETSKTAALHNIRPVDDDPAASRAIRHDSHDGRTASVVSV